VCPATRSHTDSDSGEARRRRLHETVIQRSVRQAAIAAGITKPTTAEPHYEAATRGRNPAYEAAEGAWRQRADRQHREITGIYAAGHRAKRGAWRCGNVILRRLIGS
jgi:hypothetical protein